jgi:hypothetical protein
MTSHLSSSSTDQALRRQRYGRFYEVVDTITDQVLCLPEDDGTVKKTLKGDRLDKLKHSVEILIRDAVAVVQQRKRKGEAVIHLGQYAYGSGREDPKLTYDIHVKRAYHGMLRLGFLRQTTRGVFDRTDRKYGRSLSRLTRFVAGDTLIDMFTEEEQRTFPVIVPPRHTQAIRVSVKQEVNGITRRVSLPFSESAETSVIRERLALINRTLEQNWYDLQLSDEEFFDLQCRMASDREPERTIDLSRRTLYRVFNDPELKTGGRFYGGWWQNIPKAYRSKLLVNGKRMVEFDYSNMHPTILYAWAGVDRPEDCYSGVLDSRVVEANVSNRTVRSLVKTAFNAMLNSPQPLRNAPKSIDPGRLGLTWQEVVQSILRVHAPIAHYFFTGVGGRLQRIDSNIAEQVMINFTKSNVPVLPVHDSFLVHAGYASKLMAVMDKALRKVIKAETAINRKDFNLNLSDKTNEDGAEEDTQELDEVLRYLRETGHEFRLDAFRAHKR